MVMKKTGFGIVGCGIIAPYHAKAIVNNERARLVGVCDIIRERAEHLKADFGAEKTYNDFMEMLTDPDIDIVNICTPSGLHGDMAIKAAQAGKHVLVEKPMDISKKKIDAMIVACKVNNVKLGCIFQLRTEETVLKVKQAVDDGRLGKLILADAYMKYYRSQEYYDSADWRGTTELDGGGALMNQCIHGIDLLLWIAGDVEKVSANVGTMLRNIKVEDTACAILKYNNGAMGVLQGATSVYPAQELRIELHGEKGSIIFSNSAIKQWDILGEKSNIKENSVVQTGTHNNPVEMNYKGHFIQIDDMISAIDENREPMINGESGRKAVEMILSIYDDSKKKKW